MKLSEFLEAARDAAKEESGNHLPLGYEWLEHKAEMASQLEAELDTERSMRHEAQSDYGNQIDTVARLREADAKSLELLIGWLTSEDDVDMIIHTDRWLRERCNCEDELAPCKICESLDA